MIFDANGKITTDNSDRITMESMAYIGEAILREGLTEDELKAFTESRVDTDIAREENIVMEKTIVRLDKKARLSHAQKIAVFTIAREKNDPKFKKLITIWRMERQLENYLFKKYGNQALARAKKTVSAASRSKSAMVKKAANKVKAQLNGAA